ncbi:MAG: hypothetical protein JSW28_04855 [Thermoplasmata archaeon]|nr:MAG: hypothetical protein JSW28_04855 [Thermoplasmata archaeon]
MNIQMALSSVIGFAPAILLLYILLRRYEAFFAERNIFLALAAGMVLGMIITVFHLISEYTLLIFVVLFPLFEEAAKLIILNLPKLHGKFYTIYYGAALGLGIGSMSIIAISFSVFSNNPDTISNPQTYFDLVVLSFNFCLVNSATGVMIGYGCAKEKILSYFSRAFFLHAVYNLFFLLYMWSGEYVKYAPLFVATVLAVGLFWYALKGLMPDAAPPEMLKKRRRDVRKEAREKRTQKKK